MRRRKIIKACEEYAAAQGIDMAEAHRAQSRKSLDYLSKHPDTMFDDAP